MALLVFLVSQDYIWIGAGCFGFSAFLAISSLQRAFLEEEKLIVMWYWGILKREYSLQNLSYIEMGPSKAGLYLTFFPLTGKKYGVTLNLSNGDFLILIKELQKRGVPIKDPWNFYHALTRKFGWKKKK